MHVARAARLAAVDEVLLHERLVNPAELLWLATITLAGVLPHKGMLPAGLLSFRVPF